MGNVKLFCFPYAGTSANAYLQFRERIDEKITLVPVELSGRGKRFSEGFYPNMEAAVADVFSKLKEELEGGEYALFGHSMGALFVFELVHMIQKHGVNPPVHVFVSGRNPPGIPDDKPKIHRLSDDEFLAEIFRLQGIPKEIEESKEYLEFFTPIIKADYKLVENYEYDGKKFKVSCGITCLLGQDDLYTNEDVMECWKEFTARGLAVHKFSGGHFFIFQHLQQIAEVIEHTLLLSGGYSDV
ncbi:thioesterase II family protein [Paenibacillus sp. GCM10027627]|uniref:thioesterase II family protein n=1 Tax=unclassified Paenibacillus TaxID=185978 RepID=UPI003627309F